MMKVQKIVFGDGNTLRSFTNMYVTIFIFYSANNIKIRVEHFFLFLLYTFQTAFRRFEQTAFRVARVFSVSKQYVLK